MDDSIIELFHNAPLSRKLELESLHPLNYERYGHLNEVCRSKLIDGEVLEFGVFKGQSINFMAKMFPNQKLYGFDSFEGLPENWKISHKEKYNKHKKGYFSLDKLPEVEKNVILVKGFFDKSLPEWLKTHKIQNIKLLHVDCDLYSSTKIVLENLNDYIVKGTVIVFDEFYPWGGKRYETWQEHEYKAFLEWLDTYNRKFEVLYRSKFQQCSVRITK